MKDSNSTPQDVQLSARLREARPVPPLPPRFQEAVWRRIEDAEATVRSEERYTFLDALVAIIVRPRVAFGLMMLLIVAGASVGAYKGSARAQQDAEARYVSVVAPNSLR